jgi:transcriptional regulator with XRE-family HTH domain
MLTFAEMNPEAIADASYEALNGWLEAYLVDGQVPPRPLVRTNAPDDKSLSTVPVRPGLAAALAIRWARQDAGLTQKELGQRAGISQQQVQKLENPDENPTLATLDKVARALGLTLGVGFEREGFDAAPALAARRPIARTKARRPGSARASPRDRAAR